MPAPISSLIPVAEALTTRQVMAGQDVPVVVREVLTTLEDLRQRRGRRHELATAAGGGGRGAWWPALAAWRGSPDGPRTCLAGLGRAWGSGADHRPSLSTIRRILLRVDADVLDAVLHAWLAALALPTPVPPAFRAVAVDGKTCRGARRPDGTRVHLFSIVDHGTGVPAGQVLAETKGHEIAAFATVLDRLDLTNVIVTADALHTQKAHARYLHRHGGRYVFIVKRGAAHPARPARRTALGQVRSSIGSRTRAMPGGRAGTCRSSRSTPGSGSRTPGSPPGSPAPHPHRQRRH